MAERLSTADFIRQAVAVHGNKYDYSRVQYTNAHNKVIIVCPSHGPFEQEPTNHIFVEHGCPLCALGGTPIERFWSFVRKDGSTSPHATGQCWRWTGDIRENGYGRFWFNRKSIAAHRFSYELHYGTIPDGYYVLHHCDNGQCTNPNHLFLGTIADNVHDMIEKGRNVPTRGQRNAMCKLTPEQVRDIRRLYKTGIYLQTDLAKMFDIALSSINQIILRRRWKWLND